MKSEAEKFLHSVEADKLLGVWVDPQHGQIAFGEWAAQVEATRLNRRASTRSRDASYLRSLILPTFNDRRLGAIQPNEIREWIADLEDRGYRRRRSQRPSDRVTVFPGRSERWSHSENTVP